MTATAGAWTDPASHASDGRTRPPVAWFERPGRRPGLAIVHGGQISHAQLIWPGHLANISWARHQTVTAPHPALGDTKHSHSAAAPPNTPAAEAHRITGASL